MRLAVRDFGTALDFNGSSSVITSSSSVVLSSGNCLMFRFKPKALVSQWLISRNSALDAGDSFRMRMDASGTISVFWENVEGTSTNAKTTTAKVNVGSWNYLAVYTTGSTINIYLNGTLLTSPIIGTLRQASGLQWGKSYINQYGTFIGDDLYYFNSYTPTQSDLDNFYYGNAIPSGATLIWKCDEGSGPTALDSSGNGNDGTITGATYTSDVPMKARRVVPTTPQAALSFTAAGSNVSVPHAASLNLGSSFTVFARIRPTASTGFGRILEKSESSGYSFNLESGGAFSGQITASINGGLYRSGAAFPSFTASGAASSQWASVAYVLSGGTLTFYVNGIVLGSASGVPTPSANTSNLIIGNRAALDRTWNGAIKDVSMFNGRALSADEILSLHNNAAMDRASLAGEWLFNEGAGPTASDTSGNDNHGTITGAAFTRDTPMQPRRAVGGNMALNGDFEYAPPFVAATTSAGRYVDGSASGSTTNTLFGSWALIVTGGFSSAQFDTGVFRSGGASFKLSTTGASGSATAGQGTSTGFPGASEIASALPSTSYTLTAWIKTSNVATNSAFVEAREYAGDGTQTASTASTQLSGTNDWTKTTLVFTTNANTRCIRIFLRNNVVGNISDAWFDDIVLKPTLPVTRALAGERSAV